MDRWIFPLVLADDLRITYDDVQIGEQTITVEPGYYYPMRLSGADVSVDPSPGIDGVDYQIQCDIAERPLFDVLVEGLNAVIDEEDGDNLFDISIASPTDLGDGFSGIEIERTDGEVDYTVTADTDSDVVDSSVYFWGMLGFDDSTTLSGDSTTSTHSCRGIWHPGVEAHDKRIVPQRTSEHATAGDYGYTHTWESADQRHFRYFDVPGIRVRFTPPVQTSEEDVDPNNLFDDLWRWGTETREGVYLVHDQGFVASTDLDPTENIGLWERLIFRAEEFGDQRNALRDISGGERYDVQLLPSITNSDYTYEP